MRGAGSESPVVGVVVAAGRAERFGGSIPKQFLDLAGRPVIARAVEALSSRPGVERVVAVLRAEEVDSPRGVLVSRLPGVAAVVAGGATRAESVRRGLAAVGPAEFVLVHDAARPLAGPALVDAVVDATLRHGAAIPALGVHDTVKEVDPSGRVARTLDRNSVRLAQTPQGSRTDWLREALHRAAAEGVEVGDEASALERAGRPVRVVEGDPRNIKITGSDDLDRARRLLEGDRMDLRVGTGFDIHRFRESRRLILGGVEFPGETGLEGHSDADVVLHAIMDALLGAAAIGDIGTRFPPGDPRFAGASSADLAARVVRGIDEAGFDVVNVDATVLAEKPRIGGQAGAMRAAIADCLGIPRERVGIKATTLEGLGALGRTEGIACQAVALLRRRERRA